MNQELADAFMALVKNPGMDNGVSHVQFKLFKDASDELKKAFEARHMETEEGRAFLEQRHFPADPDFDYLKTLPGDTLGGAYYNFIVDNKLDHRLLPSYEMFSASRTEETISSMPETLQFSTMRGIQSHDLYHVLTGYDTSALGEIALQAFLLAQSRSAYASIWIATATAHMTFFRPEMIEMVMDAISDGWTYGRRAKILRYERLEEQFDRKVVDLRKDLNLLRAEPAKFGSDWKLQFIAMPEAVAV